MKPSRPGASCAVVGFVLVALLLAPVHDALAQDSTGARPADATPWAGVDYLATVFDPRGDRFNFDVDVAELTTKRTDNAAKFSGDYSAEPCPDADGIADAELSIEIRVTNPTVGFVTSSRVELTVKVQANDAAKVKSVRVEGRYFDAKPNRRGTREESRTRLVSDDQRKTVTATVDNEGAYDKSALQKRADAVASSAEKLAGSVAQKLEGKWRDGTSCVKLSVSPSSTNVEPRARFRVNAAATAKDGTAIDGLITPSYTGGRLSPKKSKRAPASFDYESPKKDGAVGHLTFEQTSKRGIGRGTVDYTVCSTKKSGPGRAAPLVAGVCKRKAVPGTVTGTLQYHGQGNRGSLDVTLELTLHTLDGTVDEPGRLAISDDSTYTFSYHGIFGCAATGSGKVSGLQGLVADRYVGSVTSNGDDLYWSIRLMDAAASSYRNGSANETGTLPNRCQGTSDYLTDPVFEIAANKCAGVNAPFGFGFPYGLHVESEGTPSVVTYDCTGGPEPQTTLTGQLTEIVGK